LHARYVSCFPSYLLSRPELGSVNCTLGLSGFGDSKLWVFIVSVGRDTMRLVVQEHGDYFECGGTWLVAVNFQGAEGCGLGFLDFTFFKISWLQA
jgi:hypothetical protein